MEHGTNGLPPATLPVFHCRQLVLFVLVSSFVDFMWLFDALLIFFDSALLLILPVINMWLLWIIEEDNGDINGIQTSFVTCH